MRTDEAKKAFSWGTDNSDLTVRHTAVLSGVGAGIILCAGFETVQEIVLRLEPGRMSPPLKWTQFISADGNAAWMHWGCRMPGPERSIICAALAALPLRQRVRHFGIRSTPPVVWG